MAAVRSRGNRSTEVALASFLRRHQFRGWRRDQKLFGKPDFVFRKERVAVFADGCFWHGCQKHGRVPKGKRAFWVKKLSANAARDRRVNQTLHKLGWCVIRVWEHELAKDYHPRLLKKFTQTLRCKIQNQQADSKAVGANHR
jgi:DNA mismatch endonuclease (patch repair protein)